ncbi:hypothetical protein p2A54 (plasmid) [Aromatoleum aromaticum EbN1]|uniref:Uncharacterized protein n=1 Tax=Aromatoleum aromaticum (strain DSM 19018 / LMG 30748 / EbN1) TaxID=76114 RepID=Q5NWK5_AROAE|nr:hypothetical protein [Aromatoleum aromaticum]CAI10559.1 hypothetical protein p2A54 [Aromatoleum aromaticum EbN1]
MTSGPVLSFWDLCFNNLPQGPFERRTIAADEARSLIDAARSAGTLRCVSSDDLLAPNRERQRRGHDALRDVLLDNYDLPLRFEDFLSGSADREDGVQSVTPLQVARLQPGERMLGVSCDYVFSKNPGMADPENLFAIDAESVGFDLITALPQRGTAP